MAFKNSLMTFMTEELRLVAKIYSTFGEISCENIWLNINWYA
jgi:hypothetical protein